VTQESDIEFRPLAEADLPLMDRWLGNDHVAEWYPIDDVPKPRSELVRSHYLPMILGEEPTFGYLILLERTPVGFVQAYMIRDHPEYAHAVQVEEDAAGVDLFIGEENAIHRGLGPVVLRTFLRRIVFGEMGASVCVIGPQPENTSAIRAYEKAGFKYCKTVQAPASPGDGREYLMSIASASLNEH
jgi:RimJ/RimL family protein N-acetyltransferase